MPLGSVRCVATRELDRVSLRYCSVQSVRMAILTGLATTQKGQRSRSPILRPPISWCGSQATEAVLCKPRGVLARVTSHACPDLFAIVREVCAGLSPNHFSLSLRWSAMRHAASQARRTTSFQFLPSTPGGQEGPAKPWRHSLCGAQERLLCRFHRTSFGEPSSIFEGGHQQTRLSTLDACVSHTSVQSLLSAPVYLEAIA